MRVVDARSGRELHEGDRIPFSPEKRIVKIHEGILDAFAVMEYVEDGKYPDSTVSYQKGDTYTQRLVVRYTHPNFFGQKVGFYPS